MFQYMHYLFNETEIRFYKKYKLFPDELFQQLQNLGFSRESFKPIQKEMDRLFLLQKEESTWIKACLLYTSPSRRDRQKSRMPSSA